MQKELDAINDTLKREREAIVNWWKGLGEIAQQKKENIDEETRRSSAANTKAINEANNVKAKYEGEFEKIYLSYPSLRPKDSWTKQIINKTIGGIVRI